ncbi:MAG: FAD-dependent oxidoreductase, partial [Candidatus Bathyarchaeia archaeon]
MERIIKTDVLIVGGGTAGCFAGIEAKKHGVDVVLVDKAYAGKSGSSIMASGWWGFFNPKFEDKIDECMNLINVGSDYINNRRWTEIILRESYTTFLDILSWGVELPVKLPQAFEWFEENIAGGVKGRRGLPVAPFLTQVPLRHRRTSPFLRMQAENVGVRIVDRV